MILGQLTTSPARRRRARATSAALASALALLAFAFAAPTASADDVWRMAGTFNNWNTQDPDWQLEPVNGNPGVYRMEKTLRPGTFRFKFVKNGDWGSGHLGLADPAAGTLVQPGDDIPLHVRGLAVYEITLDTFGNRWYLDVGTIDEPIVESVVRGGVVAGRPFVLDLDGSLMNAEGADRRAVVRTSAGATIERPEASELRFEITPESPGPLPLTVTLEDTNGASTTKRFDLRAAAAHSVRVELDPSNRVTPAVRTLDLLQQPDGSQRALVSFRRDVRDVTVRVLRAAGPKGSEPELLAEETVRRLPAGDYVVEVRGGGVFMDRGPDSSLLRPAHWVRFRFEPGGVRESASSVHVRGDFNRWALPGSSQAMPLQSRADGSFSALYELPEGAHRYEFVFADDSSAPDPAASRTAPADDGRDASVVVVGPEPADFGPVRSGRINTDALRHDPRLAAHLNRVSDGLGLADVAVLTLPGDAESARVRFDSTDDAGETISRTAPLRRTTDLSGFDRWTARIMSGSPSLSYSFILTDGGQTHTTRTYTARLDPDDMQIPDWAKGAVWYQIFPERFRNGNPANDPHGEDVFAMPWNSDWYEPARGEAQHHIRRFNVGSVEELEPQFPHNNLFHWVWHRRYGGDLQGVVEKLDYLKELGVTAIYFNPVFEGESMHKYDATDFRHIDDNFGTPQEAGRVPTDFSTPAGDYEDPATWTWTDADRYFVDVLLPEAKKRGIRVVIDGVWNHTGRDFWAFEDVVEKGADSDFADWFYTEFDEAGNLVAWRAWDGPSGWLPKFKQTETGDLVQPVKDHLFAVTRRWMDPDNDGDPSDGVDGWRLDVPLDVGPPFWVDWRDHVKSINPDAVIIAEIWQPADEWLQGEHFDTQMHYPFADAVLDWLSVQADATPADVLARRLDAAFNDAPQTNLIHQNLFGSHDTDRYVSMLYNPGRAYDGANRIQDSGPNYKDSRPDEKAYELSRVGVAIQATYLGAPMIYYGDEIGMWGADDPTNRKPMPWPDTPPTERRDERPDYQLRAFYEKWFNLRSDPELGPVLRFGDVRHVDSGDPDVFIFDRSLNGVTVRVLANRGDDRFAVRRFAPDHVRHPRFVMPRSADYIVIDRTGSAE